MRYLISTVLLLIFSQGYSFAKEAVVLLSVDGLRADAISSALITANKTISSIRNTLSAPIGVAAGIISNLLNTVGNIADQPCSFGNAISSALVSDRYCSCSLLIDTIS